MTEPKYPDLHVQLSGHDSNAMSIMARVTAALKKNGHHDKVESFLAEAMSGDYENVIATAARWVSVS